MDNDFERQVVAKVSRRLIPFMIVLYIFNYLDRVNISFAKLEMKQLGIVDSVYGTGIAVFYIGYCLFEVPSNLIMMRVGARRWIARIMISWGIVSTAMLLIKGPASFYTLRFLLGVAEAGFFPGIVLYFTYWIPARERAHASAILMTATAVSGVIGSLLAEQMFRLEGTFGLAGWQWLIVIEGVPTIFIGFIVLFFLTDKPEDAKWLKPEEREALTECLRHEKATADDHGVQAISRAFKNAKLWRLIIVYCAILTGFYAIQYWTPTILREVLFPSIKQEDLSNIQRGIVSCWAAVPYLSAAIGMVFVGWNSDRTGDRPRHVAACCFIGMLGLLIACAFKTNMELTVIGLSLSAIGSFGTLGPFWAMPPSFLRGAGAAAGIALINSAGNFVSGYIAPQIMGKAIDSNQPNSYIKGLEIYAVMLFVGSCVAWSLREEPMTTADVPVIVSEAADSAS
jgi:ACS family tartrate transporter-like MFS transporter